MVIIIIRPNTLYEHIFSFLSSSSTTLYHTTKKENLWFPFGKKNKVPNPSLLRSIDSPKFLREFTWRICYLDRLFFPFFFGFQSIYVERVFERILAGGGERVFLDLSTNIEWVSKLLWSPPPLKIRSPGGFDRLYRQAAAGVLGSSCARFFPLE